MKMRVFDINLDFIEFIRVAQLPDVAKIIADYLLNKKLPVIKIEKRGEKIYVAETSVLALLTVATLGQTTVDVEYA